MIDATAGADTAGTSTIAPILWMQAEPARLARDQAEVAAFAPLLEYCGPDLTADNAISHGGWVGELPRWPFDRAEPRSLDDLIGERGLRLAMLYSAAHPMVPPVVYPLDPEPLLMEQTQSAWHVAPGGSLCLLQSLGAWRPEASITDLLAKAAGWRVEYALMKAGVIEQMSIDGIVSDSSFDHLIAQAVKRATNAGPEQQTEPDVSQ